MPQNNQVQAVPLGSIPPTPRNRPSSNRGLAWLFRGLTDTRSGGGGGSQGSKKPGLAESIPDAPDVEGTLRQPGEGLISAVQSADEAQLAAEQEDRIRAGRLASDIGQDVHGDINRMDTQRIRLGGDADAVSAQIADQQARLQEIPGAVRTEFENVRSEFDAMSTAALGRVDVQREEAMAGVMRGQTAAMQAAVSGIQGNINSQVAQINSNPNLSDAQKQSMTAQVKMQGAMSLAPAVGQTVLGFNQLAANTATSFGQISASVQNSITAQQGQLAQAQAGAFGQAQVQVGQMTNQLIELDANSQLGFAQAQNQLLGMRNMAHNSGNDLLLRLLPERDTPYADFTNSAATRLQFENDIMTKDFSMRLQEAGMDIQIAMLQQMQGTPMSNMLQGAMQGFAQTGNIFGAGMGAAGGFFGSQGPQI